MDIVSNNNNYCESYSYLKLSLDANTKQAFVNGKEVKLRRKEVEVLLVLMENQGQLVSREEILESVWDYYYDYDDIQTSDYRKLNVHISTLKSALRQVNEEIAEYIVTSYACGYTLG
jgi:DNA-binding response OmpR family regulator